MSKRKQEMFNSVRQLKMFEKWDIRLILRSNYNDTCLFTVNV